MIFQATFDPPGSEFENWIPSDHKENPRCIETIKDADYRQWARDLNNLWLQLGRKIKDDVRVIFKIYKPANAALNYAKNY